MSMVDKIRQLFSKDGDEAQKINELSKRRASLSQRRDRMYDDIGQLEKREAVVGTTYKTQLNCVADDHEISGASYDHRVWVPPPRASTQADARANHNQ